MRHILSFVLCLSLICLSAQVKFGKVSKQELMAAQSLLDQETPAEIISKVGEYKVEFDKFHQDYRATIEVAVRLKVYNKDATNAQFLNIEIPIYSTQKILERVYDIQAITYNWVDGKVEKTKLQKNDIYTERINKYKEVVKFALPQVQDGSVIEYKYTIESPLFYDSKIWYFQTEIPVLYSEFTAKYPRYFSYSKDMRGYVKEENKPTITTDYSFDNRIDKIVYKDVAAIRNKPFVLNPSNLMSSVRYELKEYDRLGYGYKNFSNHWEAIIMDLYNSIDYGRELRGNKFLKDQVAPFIQIENPKERVEAIFNYVKNTYAWNHHYGLYPDAGVKKTFQEKTGNGTDLNFILIAMLRHAGIEAQPVVLSTVSNGILNVFPSLLKLNHTIAGVELDGETLLMDATERFSQVNMLPKNDLNFSGFMMLDNEKYKKVSLENSLMSNIQTRLSYTIQDNLIIGSLDEVKSHYFAIDHLKEKNSNLQYNKQLMANYNVDITQVNTSEGKNGTSIRTVLEFQDAKAVEKIGNKLLFKPFLFTQEDIRDLDFLEERNYPIEFGTPFKTFKLINIEIPQGYTVEQMPEDITVLLSNKIGGYSIIFEHKNNAIVIKAMAQMTVSTLPPAYFGEIKTMYETMAAKENESIILKPL